MDENRNEHVTDERMNGPELIELIYKKQIAKQIAHGAKTIVKPNLYRKPSDILPFRLAVEYCAHWLAKHKMDLALETAILETNKMFSIEKHPETYIARVLRLETEVPVIPQLIDTQLDKKGANEKRYQQNLRQLKLMADKELIQSTDASQFTEQSFVEEALQMRDLQAQKTRELKPQSTHHRHHKSSSKDRHKKKESYLDISDTFTEDSEENKPVYKVYDPNYGLNDDKKELLRKKIARKERRKQNRELKARGLEAPVQAVPSVKEQSNAPSSRKTHSHRSHKKSPFAYKPSENASYISGSYSTYSDYSTSKNTQSARTGVEVMRLPKPPAHIEGGAADDESYSTYGSYSYAPYSYTGTSYYSSYTPYSSQTPVFVERESPLRNKLPKGTDLSGRRTVVHPGSSSSKGSRLIVPPEPERAQDGDADFLAKYNVIAGQDTDDVTNDPFKPYTKPANPRGPPAPEQEYFSPRKVSVSNENSATNTNTNTNTSTNTRDSDTSSVSSSSRKSKKSNPGVIIQQENVVSEQDVYE